LDKNHLTDVCNYCRTATIPESLKRRRREAIFGKEETREQRKKRDTQTQTQEGPTEKHQENMDGLLTAMNENKATQLPHEEDKENKQEQAVKQKFFDAALCWENEEYICYNSYNQKCGITKDIYTKIGQCETEEGIPQLEHTVGVRVSVCVQERLVHAGLQAYFAKLSADENAQKEKEAAEAAAKPAPNAAAGSSNANSAAKPPVASNVVQTPQKG